MLKSDFLLNEVLEQIQRKDQDVNAGKCGSCSSEGGLAKFCKNCQCFICESCVTQHEKMKILQNHVLISLDSPHIGSSCGKRDFETLPSHQEQAFKGPGKPSKKCSVHRDEILYYQCTTCNDIEICNTCLNTRHRNHGIVSFDEIMSGLTTKMKEESLTLGELTTSNRDTITLIENKQREVYQQVERGKLLIENISKEMIELIEKDKEQLLRQLDEQQDVLSTTLTSMGEMLQKEVARSEDILEKCESFTSQTAADLSIARGRHHLGDMQALCTALKQSKLDGDWISKQHVQFCASEIAPSIGYISFENKWVEKTSWDVGLIHGLKDAVTGMVTMPSGKLLLAISRETHSTYAIISSKDGSLGWLKNFSIKTCPQFTPCYATSLEKNTVVMACRHIVTKYDVSTDTSYGKKISEDAFITGIAADESDERIIITHSGKNEVRLYDSELNDARETNVGKDGHKITKIVSHSSTETYLLCDDHGSAFAVEKYTGETSVVFLPPNNGSKSVKFAAKAICGSSDGSVFVLWSTDFASIVTQYLSNGIPISRFQTKQDAVHISETKRNGRDSLVICCSRGLFLIYTKSEV